MTDEFLEIKDENEQTIALNVSVFESIVADIIENDTYVELSEKKGLRCTIEDNALKIHANIRVKTGHNVISTAEVLQEKIFERIYQMTAIRCRSIDLNISGFIF